MQCSGWLHACVIDAELQCQSQPAVKSRSNSLCRLLTCAASSSIAARCWLKSAALTAQPKKSRVASWCTKQRQRQEQRQRQQQGQRWSGRSIPVTKHARGSCSVTHTHIAVQSNPYVALGKTSRSTVGRKSEPRGARAPHWIMWKGENEDTMPTTPRHCSPVDHAAGPAACPAPLPTPMPSCSPQPVQTTAAAAPVALLTPQHHQPPRQCRPGGTAARSGAPHARTRLRRACSGCMTDWTPDAQIAETRKGHNTFRRAW